MEDDPKRVLMDVEKYAAQTGVSPAALVRTATGNPRLYDRMYRRIDLLDRDSRIIRRWLDMRDDDL